MTMKNFEIKGIWKGEYVYDDRFQPSVVKTSIPFILKIKSVDNDGLFEGMCQDDPSISQIHFAADIFGRLESTELTFTKRYPKTTFQDDSEKLVTFDQPQPDVIYQAKISTTGRILGTWKIEMTFRKLNDKVMQIGPVSGVWWMERF
jgi:hypothetical protein